MDAWFKGVYLNEEPLGLLEDPFSADAWEQVVVSM